jgi:protein SCO1
MKLAPHQIEKGGHGMGLISRRQWLAAGAAVPAIGALAGWRAAKAEREDEMKGGHFPNVLVTAHDGRKLRFYDDLIHDRKVIMNFMYSKCRGVCPGITHNLLRVQKLLEPRVGRDVFIYSLTIKPEEDTPETLRRYAEGIGAGPGWLFLTGASADMERLRLAMGAVDPDPAVDADKSQHIGMLRYGDARFERWASCPGGANPSWIAKSIGWVIGSGRPQSGPAAAL